MSDLPPEEVQRLTTEAQARARDLHEQIVVTEAHLKALQEAFGEARATADHGGRVLAWRQRTGCTDGDIDAALDEVAIAIEGGTIHSISDGGGKGIVEISDTTGRRWRITFAGSVEAFWLPGYSLIEPAQVAGAKVAGACWDESWLIEASIGDVAIHVRLFGEPISVEELAA